MSDYSPAKYVINNQPYGVPPADVKAISAAAGDSCAKIKVTPPADTVIDGQRICSVKGYYLIMKQGEAPQNEDDGELLEDVTDLSKYEKEAFLKEGLINDAEYFVAAFPYSEYNLFNRSAKNVAKFTPKEYTLFGYYDDLSDTNPETKIHYIEMNENFTPARCVATNAGGWNEGDWTEENVWFIKGNHPFMVNPDGTISARLEDNDYSKNADGTASQISNTAQAANGMASLPLIWVKRYTQDNKAYRLFCDIQLDDDFHAYAHTREDGSIEPYTWIPLLGGSLISSKCRSIAGQTQMNTQTGQNEITYCKANGSLWSTGYYSIKQLIWELETLLTRSTNRQDACGYGNYTGGTAAANLSKTGTRLTGGRFFGAGSAVNLPRKFLHAEWQMGAWERIEGWLYVNGRHYVKPAPPYNETGAGYIDTGLSMSGTSGGYITKMVTIDSGQIPTVLGGSSDKNYCCGGWYNASQVDHAIVDGACNDGLLCGGAVDVSGAVGGAGWNVSARPYCKAPISAQASDLEQ